jgi:hypothetical protein
MSFVSVIITLNELVGYLTLGTITPGVSPSLRKLLYISRSCQDIITEIAYRRSYPACTTIHMYVVIHKSGQFMHRLLVLKYEIL